MNIIKRHQQLEKHSLGSTHKSIGGKWKYICQMHGIADTQEDQFYPFQLGSFHPFQGLEIHRHESCHHHDASSMSSKLLFIPSIVPWSRSSSRSSSVTNEKCHSNTLENPSIPPNSLTLHQPNDSIPIIPMRLLTRPQSPFPHQRIRSAEVSRTMFSCTKDKSNYDDVDSDSVSLSTSSHNGRKVEHEVITILLDQITDIHLIDSLNIAIYTQLDKYIITTESVNGRDLLTVFLKTFHKNGPRYFGAALEESNKVSHNSLRNSVSRTESLDMQKFQDYTMDKSIENETQMDKICRWSKRLVCDMTNICSCGDEEEEKEEKFSMANSNCNMKHHDDTQTEYSEALELDLDEYAHSVSYSVEKYS